MISSWGWRECSPTQQICVTHHQSYLFRTKTTCHWRPFCVSIWKHFHASCWMRESTLSDGHVAKTLPGGGGGGGTKPDPVSHVFVGDVLQFEALLTSPKSLRRKPHGDTRGSGGLAPKGFHRFCFVSVFPWRWILSYGWRSHRVGHALRLEA